MPLLSKQEAQWNGLYFSIGFVFKMILPHKVCACFGFTVPGVQWVKVLVSTDFIQLWVFRFLSDLCPHFAPTLKDARETVTPWASMVFYQPDLFLPIFLLYLAWTESRLIEITTRRTLQTRRAAVQGTSATPVYANWVSDKDHFRKE